ncbi:MAG: restriction endonuclease, partial [Fimbriiglobus sp.]
MVNVGRDDQVLIAVKASRWTIQLGQAQSINTSFANLLRLRDQGPVKFSKIVVGVYYGKLMDLTDKYDIIRGICSGA